MLEIHGESSDNTFFDQDDTYVYSVNQNAELSCHLEKQTDLLKDLNDFASGLFFDYCCDFEKRIIQVRRGVAGK